MKFWLVLDVHLSVTNDVSMLSSTSRAILQLAENLNFVVMYHGKETLLRTEFQCVFLQR